MTSVSHIGLLQLDERGVTSHLARLVYLPGKMRTFYDYFCVYNYLQELGPLHTALMPTASQVSDT